MRGRQALRRSRGGLSLVSSVLARAGTDRYLQFAGTRVQYLDSVSAWGVARQIADGEYEHEGFAPRRGETVVDIGANIGLYALWASRHGGIVRAYEPAPRTFACLSQNCRGRQIEAYHAAVVGRPADGGEVTLWLHEQRSSRNTLLGREIGVGDPLRNAVQVPAISLEEVLSSDCDLLKVDCEGGEFDIVLNSQLETLRKPKRIILEFHRVAGSPDALVDRLRAADLAVEMLNDDPASPFGLIGAMR